MDAINKTVAVTFFLNMLENILCVQVMASDLQGNIEKLNSGIAFLIRHSQKLFKVSSLKPVSVDMMSHFVIIVWLPLSITEFY